MYIVGFAVLIILVFYAYTTLSNGITYFSRTGNKYYQLGNPWFYGLLIINIIILTFVYVFYQYKSEIGGIGETGPLGYPGRKGYEGSNYYLRTC